MKLNKRRKKNYKDKLMKKKMMKRVESYNV